MAKVSKVQKSASRRNRVKAYRLSSRATNVLKDVHQKKYSKGKEKKEWEDATCAVCMEHPHNAVLLLCSSYNKGCRPYMCATSLRYSNCLEQYKKAYTKVSTQEGVEPLDESRDDSGISLGLECPNDKTEVSELLCPLCRGQVKGWTVVEPAREHLNDKRRTCTQDNCSFVGTYKELRKHVRSEHPWARPREVDPSLAEKWKKLEHERERDDVISTIRSSMPGAIIFGDYVIEGNYRGLPAVGDYDVDDYLDDTIFSLHSLAGSRNNIMNSHRMFARGYRSWNDDEIGSSSGTMAPSGRADENYASRLSRYHSRSLLGRSRRRRRHRAATGGR